MTGPTLDVYVTYDASGDEAEAIAGGLRRDVFARVNGNLYSIEAVTPERLSLNYERLLPDYGCLDTSTTILVREASNQEIKATIQQLATETRYFSNRVPLSQSESSGLVLRPI
ncbi:hypothetical protein EPN81_04120 [Patescibacteria group bacterium]|nr:MAG: hypothetical protein EPN81_04120 [Patescibacteria group bacterium]